MRAAIAEMTTPERRATAYGMFNLVYGVAWFAGSALMGWMYARSIASLAIFSVVAQVLAVPCFVWAGRLAGSSSTDVTSAGDS
jgi:predicted MFS family arabinose efflux permease